MELMIKHSEIITIFIQALMITLAGFAFVGCWDELIYDMKKSRKLRKKKGVRNNMREFACPKCGYSAWALDHLLVVTCRQCGTIVQTKPVPVNESQKSFVCDEKKLKKTV